MTQGQMSVGRKALHVILIVALLPIILPLTIIGIILYEINRVIVYTLVWLWWLPKGHDVFHISSDSPIWKEYMETEILPLVARRAVVLNWSERSKWSHWSFAVRVFRTFGRGRDFNPMVVLFRPFRRARIFRFLPAFTEWKHGNAGRLEDLRRDLINALG